MLTIFGDADKRFCDGMSRRNFLRIGSLAMGGLSLPQLLRAEAAAGIGQSHKAVIMIFLTGGPPHQDMWDIKTEAPREIRGPYKPIKTNVAGIEIGESFPRLAAMSDRLVYIRSIVGAFGGHSSYQCLTGRTHKDQPVGGWPSFGSWVSRKQGSVSPGIPPFHSLWYDCTGGDAGGSAWSDPGRPGFLGITHSPFRLIGGDSNDMVLKGISADRLGDRRGLLTAMDRFRRDVDQSGNIRGMDTFHQQAMGILTSSELAEAMDLSKEDPKLVERYSKGEETKRDHMGNPDDGAPRVLRNFLIARRLVEAGARVVTLNFSHWDWHKNNFGRADQDFPMLDQGVSALVDDLHSRGLDKDVSLVVWGEFGRSPKLNKNAGRDHWPSVSCALLAGGGMRTGQVIGATNRLGEYASDRPVTFGEVHATLHHNMGLDGLGERIFDLRGVPRDVVDNGVEPIPEVI